jgi:sporulation protein YlmC with PRC-barrel domain
MYVLASQFSALPVVSLQTGETVALLRRAIVEPSSLHIVAYSCATTGRDAASILLVRDIRQLTPDCAIVNSEDELAEPHDIVRIHKLLEEGFNLTNLPAITDLGRRLGTIEDYTLNPDDFRIQKLYIKPPFLRFWLGGSLIIDRAQVIEATPQHIMVRDTTMRAPSLNSDPLPKPKLDST